MRLILLSVAVAIGIGFLLRGGLRDFPSVKLRWGALALVGVLLQFAPVSGDLGFWVLVLSFVLLLAFAAINARAPGFLLVATGLCLNALVIGSNHGMPVTREALVRSNQAATLPDLLHHGGEKHHLADTDTVLLPLADVIAIGHPIDQALSLGDVCVHVGIGWFIVIAMQPRPLPPAALGRAGSPDVA
jgi:hypothetical protein